MLGFIIGFQFFEASYNQEAQKVSAELFIGIILQLINYYYYEVHFAWDLY